MPICTVQTKQDLVPSQSTATNMVAEDVNNIVQTINELLVPIIDDTSSEYTSAQLNALYIGQNNTSGTVVVCPNLGMMYTKIGSDPNGLWNNSPYNPA